MGIKIFIALLLTLFLVAFIPVYGFRETSRQERALARITVQSAERGAETYTTACVSCHGQQGEGVVGPALKNTKLDRGLLVKVVSFGRLAQNIPMPAMGEEMGGPLKRHQIEDVVNFIQNWEQSFIIKSQAKHASSVKSVEVKTVRETPDVRAGDRPVDRGEASSPSPSASKSSGESPGDTIPDKVTPGVTSAPPASPEDPLSSEGKELYIRFGCAACHGPEGKGATGPSIVGKNKDEVIQLVRKPLSPAMPPFSPGLLSEENLNKIADFLSSMPK